MKTFLWTSLFWILMIVAWFLCLGFFDIMNPVYYPASTFIAKYTSSDIKGIIIDDFMNSDNFKKSSQFQEILDNNCVVPACDCPVMNECPEVHCPVCEASVQSTPIVTNQTVDTEKMDIIVNSFTTFAQMLNQQREKQDIVLAKISELSQQINTIKPVCTCGTSENQAVVSPNEAQKQQQIAELQSKMEQAQANYEAMMNDFRNQMNALNA